MIANEKTKEGLQTRKKRWRKEQIFAMVVACIPLAGFIVFNGFPLIISFIGMFCNVDLYDLSNIQWNNFEGFKSVFIPRHAYNLFYFDLAKYFYKAVVITLWVASTQLVSSSCRNRAQTRSLSNWPQPSLKTVQYTMLGWFFS